MIAISIVKMPILNPSFDFDLKKKFQRLNSKRV